MYQDIDTWMGDHLVDCFSYTTPKGLFTTTIIKKPNTGGDSSLLCKQWFKRLISGNNLAFFLRLLLLRYCYQYNPLIQILIWYTDLNIDTKSLRLTILIWHIGIGVLVKY